MRKIIAPLLLLIFIAPVANAAALQQPCYTTSAQPLVCTPVTDTAPLPVSAGGSGGNASVGTNAATAPTSSTQIGSVVGGNLQPVSAANPLPVSGSFTPSGTQNVTGTGTAGTPATGVVTIQGISGGTNLPVSQATAANLNATVVGTGTFADQNTQTPSSTVGITTQSCTTACASTLLSGAHAAYGISASATVTGWVLVYDATTCSANGTVTPKKAYAYTVANSTIAVSWGDLPMINSTGIAVCFSTSGPYTATSSATAYISLDYK